VQGKSGQKAPTPYWSLGEHLLRNTRNRGHGWTPAFHSRMRTEGGPEDGFGKSPGAVSLSMDSSLLELKVTKCSR
jgi:hypothetical protein